MWFVLWPLCSFVVSFFSCFPISLTLFSCSLCFSFYLFALFRVYSIFTYLYESHRLWDSFATSTNGSDVQIVSVDVVNGKLRQTCGSYGVSWCLPVIYKPRYENSA